MVEMSLINIFSRGQSDESVGTDAMISTTSIPFMTFPKMV